MSNMFNDSLSVTGASRGIGLALVAKLLETKSNAFVFATSREDRGQLPRLLEMHPEKLRIIQLDVEDQSQYAKMVSDVKEVTDRLDYVIANAGEL